jgi:hypothetical protein
VLRIFAPHFKNNNVWIAVMTFWKFATIMKKKELNPLLLETKLWFFIMFKGILMVDFKERNITVNGMYYESLLHKLRDVKEKRWNA